MRFVTVPQVLRTISHCHPDRRPAACAGRSGGIAAPSQRFGSIFVFRVSPGASLLGCTDRSLGRFFLAPPQRGNAGFPALIHAVNQYDPTSVAASESCLISEAPAKL